MSPKDSSELIDCLTAALEYAKRGFRVIPVNTVANHVCSCQHWRDRKGLGPCRTPGKHPCLRNWPERATTDEIEIRKLWESCRKANVGIATGSASSIFVLDVDPDHGGEESLASLVHAHGSLPQGLQAVSGGGGRHLYFQHPGGTLPNEVSILPGLDIRGDGGQVVAPPSMHSSGRRYAWAGMKGFHTPILPAPAWLLNAVRHPPLPGEVGGGNRFEMPAEIPAGTRNWTLFRMASSMRAKGHSDAAILAAALAENQTRCTPPLAEEEVRTTVLSACRYAPGTQSATAGNWTPLIAQAGSTALLRNKEGSPKALLANAITLLRESPEWAEVLAFNELSLEVVALKPPPWPGAGGDAAWTDNEDRLTADWLQHQGVCVSTELAVQAVQTVAQEHRFHPVREYLDGLRWDGTQRIDTWLSLYLGSESSAYTAAVGARWLLSAVARIYRPGAKADCCLILEGAQGIRKSTALKTLAGTWFTDEIADLGSKDAALQTRGVWIIEIAELDSMSRGEVSRIKAFLSRSTDRFRPPYGKRLVDCPRQCVFAGSVNHCTYLRDETGARRFWPVRCARILIEDLARDRNQLWAEAVVCYRSGSVWWLDSFELNRLAEHEQGERYEGDPWDELIAAWVEHPTPRHDWAGPVAPFTSNSESVCITDVLLHCIGKRQDQWTQADKNRVGRSLRVAGWERYRDREGASLAWRFRRAER